MYKKIIVIIILSFFFILSCAKNNPNNPNSSESGNVSDGGDTGGSTGDGGNTGDGGQTQSPLAKYAGAWKDGYKVYVIGEEGYFIYSASSSSGSGPILIESGEKLSDTQYMFLYDKEPKKKIDATITFNDENNASIEGVQYNYFSSKDEFFKEIIVRFKKQLFYFLKDNYKKEFLPNENHVMFLYLMLEYFKDSYYKDKIMREAEFIAPELYFKYLNKDFNFYLETLDELNYSFERKKIIVAILLGIAHYMRIEFFYTKNIANKEEFLEKISYFLKNGVSL